ncbi:hypothetical protein FS837_006400 [Tulasnella sp. UAMH 9824]|nr:hypothetical protein FS837_006400 [Tulasnella sp. UAMH 9824]
MQLKLSIFFALAMSAAQFVLAQDTGCADFNHQCGGTVNTWTWTGPTCCIDSANPDRELYCKFINTAFSVCVPVDA